MVKGIGDRDRPETFLSVTVIGDTEFRAALRQQAATPLPNHGENFGREAKPNFSDRVANNEITSRHTMAGLSVILSSEDAGELLR